MRWVKRRNCRKGAQIGRVVKKEFDCPPNTRVRVVGSLKIPLNDAR